MLEYTFERVTQKSLTAFYTLFKTRNKDYYPGYFENRYNTKWTGKEFIAVLAYDGKKPVGMIGSLPMFVDYQNKKYLTCQFCDIVVHPDYQKQGISVKLINKLCEIAKEEGIAFIFGAPNNQADAVFAKLGWFTCDYLKIYTFKTTCIPLNKIANKFNLHKLFNIYIKLMLWIVSKKSNTEFKNSTIDGNYGGIIKDANFIKHKNYSHNYLTLFRNFKIWWKIDDGFVVGDIEKFDKLNFNKLFSTLRFLCLILGFHNFKIITSSDTFLDRLFSLKNDAETSCNIYFFDISSKIDFSKIKIMNSDLNTF